MNLYERGHFLVRAWRYRLWGESFGISFLRSLDLRHKTVVDIGANRGIYSYWMHSQVGAKGQVIAFEPQPELAAYLHNLKAGFGLNTLQIAEVGLSSKPGELTLRRPQNHWGNASFEWHQNRVGGLDFIQSPVTTLDRHFADGLSAPISFIKCDVEGHEFHVFRGARQIFTRDRPTLLFECSHPDVPDCPVFNDLRGLDYEGFCFTNQGLASVSEYRNLYSQLHKRAKRDFVFLPKEQCESYFAKAFEKNIVATARLGWKPQATRMGIEPMSPG